MDPTGLGRLADDENEQSTSYENHWAMRGHAAGQYLEGADFKSSWILLKKLLSIKLLALVYISLLFAGLWFFFAATTADNELHQSFYIELTAGIATFLLFPLIVACGIKFGVFVYPATILASVVCGIASSRYDGVTQSFLIEASVGFLLLVGLEFAANVFVDTAASLYESAIAEEKQHEQNMGEAEEQLSGSPFERE